MMAMTTSSSMSVKPFLEAVDREDFMGKMDYMLRVFMKANTLKLNGSTHQGMLAQRLEQAPSKGLIGQPNDLIRCQLHMTFGIFN